MAGSELSIRRILPGVATESLALAPTDHWRRRRHCGECLHPSRRCRATAPRNRLVVDDEEMVRRLAARMLLLLGYKVLEARDGHEAISCCSAVPNGSASCSPIWPCRASAGGSWGRRSPAAGPQVRVLYMSGFPAQTDGERRRAGPQHPFIQKPFTSEQLGRRVRDVLAAPLEQ